MTVTAKARVQRLVMENVIWVRFPTRARRLSAYAVSAGQLQDQPDPVPIRDILGLSLEPTPNEETSLA